MPCIWEREIAMSRRNKQNKVKPRKQIPIQKIIFGLQRIIDNQLEDKNTAQSLLEWYSRTGKLTKKQKAFAEILIFKKPKKQKKNEKYYLYAIGDGEYIKLGVTTDVKRRLKSLQTGHPKVLKELWRYYVGKDKKEAYKTEKQLHRYSRKHRCRGEWFKQECLVIVDQFVIKERYCLEIEQKEHDLELLNSC